MTDKIKVLIVDDSALVRKMLKEVLETDPKIEVVGAAPDPLVARDKIKSLSPDVLTLDVEMPRMDGVTFLRNLMRLRPMPVVMVSTLTEQGADVTLDALELGAVDYVTKPKIDLAHTLEDYTKEIVAKVKTAFGARSMISNRSAKVAPPSTQTRTRNFKTTDRLIAIGASTGGTEAIKSILVQMPPDAPGCVIAQHIPEAFSGPFAERMDRCSPLIVCEAKDGQEIRPGHAFIAPGHSHLEVERSGARWICRLSDADPVNRHRPSVDVLFDSVSQAAGRNAVGVLLTGMGVDGAEGLKRMRQAGSHTIAQDEKSSVVWGMPGAAVKIDAAVDVMPLNKIAEAVLDLVEA